MLNCYQDIFYLDHDMVSFINYLLARCVNLILYTKTVRIGAFFSLQVPFKFYCNYFIIIQYFCLIGLNIKFKSFQIELIFLKLNKLNGILWKITLLGFSYGYVGKICLISFLFLLEYAKIC